MKKFIALIVIIVLSTSAFSQSISAGIKGGIGLPFFSGSDYDDWVDAWTIGGDTINTQIKISFQVGAFISIDIMDFLAIQPEIYYTSSGGFYGNDNGYFADTVNFIEIPILIKAKFNTGGIIVNAFAGPDVLIRLGTDDEGNIYDDQGEDVGDITWNGDYLNSFLFQLVFGAGVDIPFEGFFITIDARYMLGLTQRFTNDSGTDDWKQNNIQIMVGIGFNLM
jgi:hypothetical protein